MDLAATVYAPPRAKAPWRVDALYAPSALRYFGFARHALTEALRLTGASGGVVLLPDFICRDVLASIAAAGARPAFYEVGPDLTPLHKSVHWPEAKAVLAVDYFGFPQDLAPFAAYAAKSGATLIEDAAHALFSRDEKDRLLGTRAPLGILSLRKSLPLPNGGALLADAEFAGRLPAQLPFSAPASRRQALKSATRHFLALTGATTAHAALTAARTIRGDSSGRVAADADCETTLPATAEPCAMLAEPLFCADPAIEASRRRALWRHCDALARRHGFDPIFPSLPDGVVPYGYALRSADEKKVRAAYAAEGLTVLPWPDLPDAVVARAPDFHRNVLLVHFLW